MTRELTWEQEQRLRWLLERQRAESAQRLRSQMTQEQWEAHLAMTALMESLETQAEREERLALEREGLLHLL